MNQNKRWVATWVVLSFLFLLGVTNAPLSAASRVEKSDTAVSTADSGTNCIEQERDEGSYHKKKSALPLLIGVLAAGAVAAVLILVVFKTKYDITGNWSVTFNATNAAKSWDWTLEFSGDKKSGDVYEPQNGFYGTYNVDGKNVDIVCEIFAARDLVMTGSFTDKETMTGTAVLTGLVIGGVPVASATWTARKAGSNAMAPGATMGNRVTR